ncbi:MAG: CARDB domain-containing protein [Acidobacteriota bacterium]
MPRDRQPSPTRGFWTLLWFALPWLLLVPTGAAADTDKRCLGPKVRIAPDETWTANIGDTRDFTITATVPACHPWPVLRLRVSDPDNATVRMESSLQISDLQVKVRLKILPAAPYQQVTYIPWRLERPTGSGWILNRSGSVNVFTVVQNAAALDIAVTELDARTPTDDWDNLEIDAIGKTVSTEILLDQAEDLRLRIDGQTILEHRCDRRDWNGYGCAMPTYRTHRAPGSYQVEVCADPDNNSGDGDTSNNCRVTTVNVPALKPDLVPQVSSSEPPRYGEPWRLQVKVRNQGNLNSPPFAFRLRTPDGVDPIVQRPALGWGHEDSFEVNWTPLQSGVVTVVGIVDPDGQVAEHDESNNEDPYTDTVVGSEPTPDPPNLLIDPMSVRFDPPAPRVGDQVTVFAEMVNVGGATTVVAPRLEISVEGTSSILCPQPLQPGWACEGMHDFTPQSAGPLTVRFQADPQNRVDEGDDGGEDDNLHTVTLDVGAVVKPNLWILAEDIALPQGVPAVGDDLAFTITVRNDGADTEGPVTLRILRDSIPVATLETPTAIAGGSSSTVPHTWPNVDAGNHQLRVLIDPFDTIDELSEDDNSRSLNFTVEGPQSQVTCQGLWVLEHVVTDEVQSSIGSLTDGCDVRWGNNHPTQPCLKTTGQNDMWAIWALGDDGCPISVSVSTGDNYHVSIQ